MEGFILNEPQEIKVNQNPIMLSCVNWIIFQPQLKMRMLGKGDRQEMERHF